jgi:hypothetical protein
MRTAVKAGAIGAGVYILFTLLGYVIYFVPLESVSAISYAFYALYTIIGFGIGLLAALWLPPPRIARRTGGVGALAGILAFVASSCIALILYVVFSLTTGIPQRYLERAALAGDTQWLANPVAQIALYACGGLVGLVIFGLLGWMGGIVGYALGKRRVVLTADADTTKVSGDAKTER